MTQGAQTYSYGHFNCYGRGAIYGNFKILNWKDDDNARWDISRNLCPQFAKLYGEEKLPHLFNGYTLEYYRDSSLNVIAYVLYQKNGTKLTKFTILRLERGPLSNQYLPMGIEETAGVRPGIEMPLRNYTFADLVSSATFVQSLLSQVG